MQRCVIIACNVFPSFTLALTNKQQTLTVNLGNGPTSVSISAKDSRAERFGSMFGGCVYGT